MVYGGLTNDLVLLPVVIGGGVVVIDLLTGCGREC